MGFINRAADNANKTVQFEVRENANSVSFDYDRSKFTNENVLKITVELVSKNKQNQKLYSLTMADLKMLLKQFMPKLGGVIPFSFGKSLILNDDNYLLVTVSWDGIEEMNGFKYAINSYVQTTESPLIIKEILVEDERDIDSEFYPVLLLSGDIERFETVVMVANSAGALEQTKVLYNKTLITSMTDSDADFLAVGLSQNQKFRVEADDQKVYLLNF